MNLGYLGKPYDTATGLYNYGYRDYKPQAARFTTVDPIRDGNNWFAYVNNDPVNWIDLWGLSPDDKDNANKAETELANVTNGFAFPLGKSYSNDYVVTSVWGPRDPVDTPNGTTNEEHSGIDLYAIIDTRVNSVMDGTVTKVGFSEDYGNYVQILHPSGVSTYYAHLNYSYVTVGQRVVAGQHIANVGESGKATGPHLHFGYDGNMDGEFSKTDQADNPDRILYACLRGT